MSKFRELEGVHRDYGIACALFQLVLKNLSLNDKERANDYRQQFKELDSDSNPNIRLREELLKALILKQGQRIKSKVKSQEILLKIVNEETYSRLDHELTVIAMLNLCELLLDEYRAYGVQEVLTEVDGLLKETFNVAKTYQSNFILVEVMTLQSRFSLLRGKIEKADSYLDQAIAIIEEKDLRELTQRVQEEKQSLQSKLRTWEEMTQEGASVAERFKELELIDYIRKAVEVAEKFH